MGILSATPITNKNIYRVELLNQNNIINTITVTSDGLYQVYYIKEGKTINRVGRIINIIHNSSIPAKSYILFDMSEDNSSIKERIHFCQIQTIIDITPNDAYRIALEHGFVGTLDDWMEYMKGPSGLNAYELAVEKGYFEGTEEEWFLKYGEVGLVNEKKIDKVQDAVPGNLAGFTADGQIYDSGINAANPTKVNVFIGYNSINNAVKQCIAKANDICIVKTPINEELAKLPSEELNEAILINEPIEYTAYVYDGKHWRAMQGNYNASNIFIGKNLSTRYDIGNFKVKNNELTELPTENMSLADFWNTAFVEEKLPEIVDPPIEEKTGTIKIITDIGSVVSYTNISNAKTESFIASEETTIVKVALGEWALTSIFNGDIINKVAYVKEENVEYDALMLRVGHAEVIPGEDDWE